MGQLEISKLNQKINRKVIEYIEKQIAYFKGAKFGLIRINVNTQNHLVNKL